MNAAAKDSVKMMHVNKRRMQTYKEFIQAYKQYRENKEQVPRSVNSD
jgi:hypothetical protein